MTEQQPKPIRERDAFLKPYYCDYDWLIDGIRKLSPEGIRYYEDSLTDSNWRWQHVFSDNRGRVLAQSNVHVVCPDIGVGDHFLPEVQQIILLDDFIESVAVGGPIQERGDREISHGLRVVNHLIPERGGVLMQAIDLRVRKEWLSLSRKIGPEGVSWTALSSLPNLSMMTLRWGVEYGGKSVDWDSLVKEGFSWGSHGGVCVLRHRLSSSAGVFSLSLGRPVGLDCLWNFKGGNLKDISIAEFDFAM